MWQVFPTETRRFNHCVGVMMEYNFKRCDWVINFEIRRTEVHMGSHLKCYGLSANQPPTDRDVTRLLAVAGRNQAKISVHTTDKALILFIIKPIPACEFPSCDRHASVPTYEYNQGRPYYCSDHRGGI